MTADGLTADRVAVLLVEDNPGDVRLAKEAFAAVDADVDVTVADDGGVALEDLRAAARDGADLPDLVLLDLDRPTTSGHEVLAAVKSDPALRHVPVIVFTTSDDARDVNETYANHANAFVTKPATVDRFIDVFESLRSFWLASATLPTGPPER